VLRTKDDVGGEGNDAQGKPEIPKQKNSEKEQRNTTTQIQKARYSSPRSGDASGIFYF
jgi:hypothetical protein